MNNGALNDDPKTLRKYIDNKKVAVVLKIAACAIEENDADGMTLNDVYNLLDNAFRTVLGDAVFDDLYNSYLADGKGDNPEEPKF